MTKNSIKIIALALIAFISLNFAFENNLVTNKDYYFISGNNDTTFCKKIEIGRANGAVTRIFYTDFENKEFKIKGTKDCLKITTYFLNGQTWDAVPIKPNKPDGYQRHMARVVDGPIRVYDYKWRKSQLNGPGSVHGNESTVGKDYRMVKISSKVYYDINKKNIKNYIKPYLERCRDFKDAFEGEYSPNEEEFNAMIELYNSLCPVKKGKK